MNLKIFIINSFILIYYSMNKFSLNFSQIYICIIFSLKGLFQFILKYLILYSFIYILGHLAFISYTVIYISSISLCLKNSILLHLISKILFICSFTSVYKTIFLSYVVIYYCFYINLNIYKYIHFILDYFLIHNTYFLHFKLRMYNFSFLFR